MAARNAVIAATYISLGALLGFAFHSYLVPSLLISAVVVVAAIVLAPPWLRQKIIWQKASIPYLFRLADAAPTIKHDDAKILLDLIEAGAPPDTPPHQIVISGPIGSGRTSMAAGIGTEFAFKQNKVRYLGLDCLLEFAANATERSFPDDSGQRLFPIGHGVRPRSLSSTASGHCLRPINRIAKLTLIALKDCSKKISD